MTTPTHPRVLVTEYTEVDADEFELRDLRRLDQCLLATRGIDHVYALAADVGGYTGEFGLGTRIVRFHTIYGPYGTYDGGREKVPAAPCRKVVTVEPTYSWIEKQVTSRRPPWVAAGR